MRGYGNVEAEMLREIRELALSMIRFGNWAEQAREAGRYQRQAELLTQRALARQRRSELMRQMWNARHPSRQVVAVLSVEREADGHGATPQVSSDVVVGRAGSVGTLLSPLEGH